ncbi:hypothetical protein B5M09_005291 [Aphanomyces astaci]|uniref:Uncharacterized protein n=1 Tax=Aphanomyces astaci TaxID=112090 RepID=A0A3R7Y587_APHAT|nr:hypothetical protein B5M09_005291 [Aphanomyces astaci]
MADPNGDVAATVATVDDVDMEVGTPAGIAERAQRSINPPGVPPSFRRAGRSTNIARTIMSRELGHGRRYAFHDEAMWIENESATKVAFTCRLTSILMVLCSTFWDVVTGKCLYEATLRHAIISVSFHPCGTVLGIASGTCVYTWDYQQHSIPRIAMFSNQTLRSVSFLPDPTKILVGEANEKYTRPLGTVPSDLTVTLTLWEFDLAWSVASEPSTSKAMYSVRLQRPSCSS